MHARLNRKFFYYAAKYAQYIHDVIPVRDLLGKNGLPTTPYYLAKGRKPAVKHFRVLAVLLSSNVMEYPLKASVFIINIINKE